MRNGWENSYFASLLGSGKCVYKNKNKSVFYISVWAEEKEKSNEFTMDNT